MQALGKPQAVAVVLHVRRYERPAGEYPSTFALIVRYDTLESLAECLVRA